MSEMTAKYTRLLVDILISAVYALLINDQKGIIRAAKELGTVKRVIPCDFGTPGARGVRDLHDMVRPFPSSHHGYQKLSITLEIRDTRLYRGARRAAHIHLRRLVDAALPPAALTHQGARRVCTYALTMQLLMFCREKLHWKT